MTSPFDDGNTLPGPSFENFEAKVADLPPETKMECGVCWHVYDPLEGDDLRGIEPGRSFASLPEDYCCPDCAAVKERFLVLAGERRDAGHEEDIPESLVRLIERVVIRYQRTLQEGMRDVPILNRRLSIEAVGFRPWADGAIGMIITPWFINCVLVPGEGADWSMMPPGSKRVHALPSGHYEFIVGDLEGITKIQSLSLFSPVAEFEDHQAARATAEACMTELFNTGNVDDHLEAGADLPIKGWRESEAEPELFSEAPPVTDGVVTRRDMLRGNLKGRPVAMTSEPKT